MVATHAFTSGWVIDPIARPANAGRIQLRRSLVRRLRVAGARSTVVGSHWVAHSESVIRPED